MEKAILKTLIYGDIFDYPLKAWEIHKWLIGKKASLQQVEKGLRNLNNESSIKHQAGYYFLPRRIQLVTKRKLKQKQSDKYLKQARVVARIFKIIPWVKLVGVSGSLAMQNAGKLDDIDLFVITDKNRLFLSRILMLGILNLLGKRRKPRQTKRQTSGKICINLLLEEDSLAQTNKDIYLAHEILQMRPLWQKDGIYSKYLADNEWAFKFLPNWTSTVDSINYFNFSLGSKSRRHPSLIDFLEKIAKWIQLKYMRTPQGMEKISNNALYFHPQDCRPQVLELYDKKIKQFISTS